MNNIDVITMLGNISQSLAPVQTALAGFAYLLGILFFLTAIKKLRVIGNFKARSNSQEKIFGVFVYILAGSALIFLPSALTTLSNTAFGEGNILSYANFNKIDIYRSSGVVVRIAGLIWFIRGTVLLVHASEPSEKHGAKGLLFLFAGILAINFDNTIAMLNTSMDYLAHITIKVKQARGY